jgi:Raf kinase inhibitor-like YbhB/YbcL family protein
MSFKLSNILKDDLKTFQKQLQSLNNHLSFNMTSSLFINGGVIPNDQLRVVPNINESPPLSWYGAPSNTVEFVLIMYDETPISGWTHWIVYGILPPRNSLVQDDSSTDLKFGLNDFGNALYDGPDPPADQTDHVYVFTLYALSKELVLGSASPDRSEILIAMGSSIIATAVITGTYKNPTP